MPVTFDNRNSDVPSLGLSREILERTENIFLLPSIDPLRRLPVLNLLALVPFSLSILLIDHGQHDTDHSCDAGGRNSREDLVRHTHPDERH
jgi:hypothetical protein